MVQSDLKMDTRRESNDNFKKTYYFSLLISFVRSDVLSFHALLLPLITCEQIMASNW